MWCEVLCHAHESLSQISKAHANFQLEIELSASDKKAPSQDFLCVPVGQRFSPRRDQRVQVLQEHPSRTGQTHTGISGKTVWTTEIGTPKSRSRHAPEQSGGLVVALNLRSLGDLDLEVPTTTGLLWVPQQQPRFRSCCRQPTGVPVLFLPYPA